MRFSKVKIEFGPSESFTFPLDADILTSKYVVTMIDGLEPAPMTVAVSSSLNGEGTYQGRQVENKKITIAMGYRPDYSIGERVSDLRDELYKLLTPKVGSHLKLSLLDSSNVVLAYIYGQISIFDTTLFDKNPMAQITIATYSPYLSKDRVYVSSPGSMSINPMSYTNLGNAPTGFKFRCTLTDDMSVFEIRNEPIPYTKRFYIAYGFALGDIININTHPGSRTVTVTSGATTVNLLSYLSTDTAWMQLDGGVNILRFTNLNFTLTELSHIPRYWGA